MGTQPGWLLDNPGQKIDTRLGSNPTKANWLALGA
jgi:hypothetical protein